MTDETEPTSHGVNKPAVTSAGANTDGSTSRKEDSGSNPDATIPPGAILPVIHTEAFPEVGSGDGVSEFGEESDRQFGEWVREYERRKNEEIEEAKKEDAEATRRAALWIENRRNPPHPNRLRRILHRIAVFFSCVMLVNSLAIAADPVNLVDSGSGIVIRCPDRKLRILTCAHCSPELGQTVLFKWKTYGDAHYGNVSKFSGTYDLALIDIEQYPGLTPPEMSDESPGEGTVRVVGFGKGHFVSRKGKIAGIVEESIDYRSHRHVRGHKRRLVHIKVPGRFRDSGAPVLDDHGRLVGIVVSYNADTFAIPIEDVREFLGEK